MSFALLLFALNAFHVCEIFLLQKLATQRLGTHVR
jgi:hypothetical protein